jgi:O-antigen/teichoic acid export membrane protein
MHVSGYLKYLLVLYFLLHTFGGIFNMFINGVGKIKLQTISLVTGALLFVPLAIGFIKYLGMGMEGIVLASIIANFYTPFIAPIQYYRIINNKANGIWNK